MPWAKLPVCIPAPVRRVACLKAVYHCWRCYMSWLHPKALKLKRRRPFKTSLCLCQLLPPCTPPFNMPSHQEEGGMRGHPSQAQERLLPVHPRRDQIPTHSDIWNNPGLFLTRDTRQSAFNPQTIKLPGVSHAEKIWGFVATLQIISLINRLM